MDLLEFDQTLSNSQVLSVGGMYIFAGLQVLGDIWSLKIKLKCPFNFIVRHALKNSFAAFSLSLVCVLYQKVVPVLLLPNYPFSSTVLSCLSFSSCRLPSPFSLTSNHYHTVCFVKGHTAPIFNVCQHHVTLYLWWVFGANTFFLV